MRQPEAHEAAELLRWWSKGQLHLRVPHPTVAQVEAIDLAQSSLTAREADELRRLREQHERTKDHG